MAELFPMAFYSLLYYFPFYTLAKSAASYIFSSLSLRIGFPYLGLMAVFVTEQ